MRDSVQAAPSGLRPAHLTTPVKGKGASRQLSAPSSLPSAMPQLNVQESSPQHLAAPRGMKPTRSHSDMAQSSVRPKVRRGSASSPPPAGEQAKPAASAVLRSPSKPLYDPYAHLEIDEAPHNKYSKTPRITPHIIDTKHREWREAWRVHDERVSTLQTVTPGALPLPLVHVHHENPPQNTRARNTPQAKTTPLSPTEYPTTAPPTGMFSELAVGDIVEVRSMMSGTVRFIGEVDFAPGVWIGLELPHFRGKHDGTVQGRRYFTCPPNRGLFCQPVMASRNGIPCNTLIKAFKPK
eukprot:m.63283 g.63283  ORF g.63283 m.63283 type:complete len:295 (-) comp49629_c0_seq2:48-932(-)